MVWIAGVAAREVSAKKLLWGGRAVRAVFSTSNERKEVSVGRARRARCLPNDERAQEVLPTTNERKEARAAREPHNDSVSDELLWGAHAVRAVFRTLFAPPRSPVVY